MESLPQPWGGWFEKLFALSPGNKRRVQVLVDIVATALAFTIAFAINGLFVTDATSGYLPVLCALLVAAPIAVQLSGSYSVAVRYIRSFFAVRLLIVSIGLGFLAGGLVSAYGSQFYWRLGVDVFTCSLILMAAPRLVLRWIAEHASNARRVPALIYGAGSAGRQLVGALESSVEYRPVAFVEDNSDSVGRSVRGVPVFDSLDLERVVEKYGVAVVLLAIPSASYRRRKSVLKRLEPLPVRVQTVPGIVDLVSGKAKVSELRDVSIEDLLGRDAAEPVGHLISQDVTYKHVMITGAGGSIGSELARQALHECPRTLVLYEQGEYSLYAIESELQNYLQTLPDGESQTQIIPVLGTVQNRERIEAVMRQYKVQTVYHAAAYKHVPLVEHNPLAGLKNNVIGTWTAASAALAAGVECFVLISTDKAVRPTNVMGASKRFAELAIQALASTKPEMRLSMVRFGNVLGSSGSVVPKFRQQISEGGPITVTHPDITRYFMTIPEAAQLVIQAGALGGNGEVFVLDMGKPVRIYDLAKRMIRLAGLELKDQGNPDGDIEIHYSGLRPGEKLYEELLIDSDDRETKHSRIRVSDEPSLSMEEFDRALQHFMQCIEDTDMVGLRKLLLEMPIAWAPKSDALFDHSVLVCAHKTLKRVV